MTGEKILIVEDDRILATYLQEVLEQEGYRVPAIAATGPKAILAAAELQPDLVLMDIRLRGKMTGIQAAQEILARYDIPIIYLTALSDAATLQEATATAPFGYLIKPFQDKALFVTLTVALFKHQLEKKLRASEGRFRGLFNSSPVGILIFDLDGCLQELNQAACDIFGVEGLAQAANYQLLNDPDLPPDVKSRILQGQTVRFSSSFDFDKARQTIVEIESLRKGIIYLDTVISPLTGDGLTTTGYLIQLLEITERVQTEIALRESEHTFRSIVEQSYDGIILTDENGRIIEWNQSQEVISGVRRQDVIGKFAWDVQFALLPPEKHTPETYRYLKSSTQEFSRTGQASWMGQLLEREIVHPDGSTRVLQIVAYPIKTEKGYISSTINRDITLTKLAEATLRESEERLMLVMDGSMDGFWDWNPVTGTAYRSPRWAQMLGYQPEEVDATLQGWAKLIVAEDLTRAMQVLSNHLEGRLDYYECEYRMIAKNGDILWILDRGRVVARDAYGRPLRVTGTQTDITARKRAEQAEMDQRILAEALRDAAAAINSTLEVDAILDKILQFAGRVVPHTSGTVMLLKDGFIGIVRSVGYTERRLGSFVENFHYPLDELPSLKYMADTGRPLAIPDVNSFVGWVSTPGMDWLRSYAGAPIRSHGKTLGFINLDSETPGAFQQAHAERLQAFADQAALAIENARLYAEKAQLAITDDLTGLYNRRGIYQLGQNEVDRSRRYYHPLSVIFLDIDHFRKFNKKFGHQTGDRVLRLVVDTMKRSLRAVDLLGRYGGEEFVVLLPETGIGEALQAAERLRSIVEQTPIETDDGPQTITISLGVTQLMPHITDFGVLIDHADSAMLSAKRAGRNRVEAKKS